MLDSSEQNSIKGTPPPRKFSVGDVVRLNGGSPHLTVTVVGLSGIVRVYWFNGADVMSAHFPSESLTKVETFS